MEGKQNSSCELCQISSIVKELKVDNLIKRRGEILRMLLNEFIESKTFKKMDKVERSNIIDDTTKILELNQRAIKIIN